MIAAPAASVSDDMRADVSPGALVHCFSPQTKTDMWEAWSRSGNQGSQWNRAVISLRNLRDFELIFEGIRSWDLSGGASLDDLEYLDCAPSK